MHKFKFLSKLSNWFLDNVIIIVDNLSAFVKKSRLQFEKIGLNWGVTLINSPWFKYYIALYFIACMLPALRIMVIELTPIFANLSENDLQKASLEEFSKTISQTVLENSSKDIVEYIIWTDDFSGILEKIPLDVSQTVPQTVLHTVSPQTSSQKDFQNFPQNNKELHQNQEIESKKVSTTQILQKNNGNKTVNDLAVLIACAGLALAFITINALEAIRKNT